MSRRLSLFALFLWMSPGSGAFAETPSSPFAKWEPEIAKFEAADRAAPPPAAPVLFVGSSSIRKWDLARFWPGLPYLNRGFGGSKLPDVVHFFDRVVKPYQPRAVVLYAGDNDFGAGATAEEVVASFSAFADKLQKAFPGTPLLFISIKPSRKRWKIWPEMDKANRVIAALCEASPELDFADIATPMLATAATPETPPDAALFEKDGLHMSSEGYALWKGVLQPWLNQFNP
ncbi:MAG: Lysophospholipase L1 [Verrucomicrobia bacterium]|nr:MAG: Lysophospholipase L1 [Verrucomicrobiota bacterium]